MLFKPDPNASNTGEDMFRKIAASKAVRTVLRDIRSIEREIWRLFDEPRVSPVEGEMFRKAETLASRDMGTAMTVWTIIREAALRIDAATGRRSGVGAFGDNPIKPAGSYPIDLYVRTRSSTGNAEYYRTFASDARRVGDLAKASAPDTAPRPGTVKLSLRWDGPGQARGGTAIRRTLVVEAPDVLGQGALYDWGVVVAGTSIPAPTSPDRRLRMDVDITSGQTVAVSLTARDTTGQGIVGIGLIKAPNPSLSLSVNIAGSTPYGAPQSRTLQAADGSAMTSTPVKQQGYSPIAIRVAGRELGPPPYRLNWSTDHNRSGSETLQSLPVQLSISALPGPAPTTNWTLAPSTFGPFVSPGFGSLVVDTFDPAPSVVTEIAQPERFTLTVSLTDAAGQTAQAVLGINPWRPVQANGFAGDPTLPDAPAGGSVVDVPQILGAGALDGLVEAGLVIGIEDLQSVLTAMTSVDADTLGLEADLPGRLLANVLSLRDPDTFE